MLINKQRAISKLHSLLHVWLAIIKLSGILYWLELKSTSPILSIIILLEQYCSDLSKNNTAFKTKKYVFSLLSCYWKMERTLIGSFKKRKVFLSYIIFALLKWKWTSLRNLSMKKSLNFYLTMEQILSKKL